MNFVIQLSEQGLCTPRGKKKQRYGQNYRLIQQEKEITIIRTVEITEL